MCAIRTFEDAVSQKPVTVTPAYPDAFGPPIDSIPKGIVVVTADSKAHSEASGQSPYQQTIWAFESILNPRSSAMMELFAWEVIRDLPVAVHEGGTFTRVTAWLGPIPWPGMRFAGQALCCPHGIAMAVGSMFPDSSHGAVLAAFYQACLEFTCASAVPKFAVLARILDRGFGVTPDAAAAACAGLLQEFLEQIDLNGSLRTFGYSGKRTVSACETIHGAS